MPRLAIRLVFALIGLVSLMVVGHAEQVQQVSPCDLKKDPAAFDHKLVEVTAFLSHGFEDFTLFDPACPADRAIWLEYGGRISSGTVFCCGANPSRTRSEPLAVEGLQIPLVTDAQFEAFDRLIHILPDRVVHATLVGHFFSGISRSVQPGVSDLGGYGHLGCCSLLAIEAVRLVESQNRADFDYRNVGGHPDADLSACGNRRLTGIDPTAEVLAAQRRAEADSIEWPFTDPRRVATASLARILGIEEKTVTGLVQSQQSAGRILYRWKPKGKAESYLVVTSRLTGSPFMQRMRTRSHGCPLRPTKVASEAFPRRTA